MSCGTHLSVAEIAQVKCLRETTTMSMMEIAQHIGRSKTAVFNCLKREAEGRDYVKQPGRPKKISETTARAIVRCASNTPITCNQIIAQYGLNVEKTTVARILKAGGLRIEKMKKKPCISNKNKKRRLDQCNEWINGEYDFDSVVFSDEKRFRLDGPDGNSNYWRDPAKKPLYKVRRQNGGGSVMVWGAIGIKGKSELIFEFTNISRTTEIASATHSTHHWW